MKKESDSSQALKKMSLIGCLLFFFSIGVFAQQLTVKGIVKDETGEPIIGASVLVKGTTNGVITNLDGNFVLQNVAGNATIEVTFVGFLPQTVKPSSSPLNIILKEDTQTLDEVVVVGYGVQKKSVVTASIAKVNSETLEQTSPVRMDNALRGLASGVQVIAGDGQPGAGTRVRVRGIGTINTADPLYIVDGMPLGGGLDNINPSDIESIEVLKDAASGAVYGARAANGVVLVTTKQGKQGKVQVSYNMSFGWQSAWRKRDMLNATEYATLMNRANADAGLPDRYSVDQIKSFGVGTDWQDVLFNDNAPVQNHQVSLSGASERVKYYFSMGFYDQEGIVGGDYGRSNYKRWSFRSNTEYTVFDESKTRNWLKSLKFNVNASYSRVESKGGINGSLTGSVLGNALFMDPTMAVYADDESELSQSWDYSVFGKPIRDKKTGRLLQLPPTDFNELGNPLALLSGDEGTKNNSDKIIANLSMDFNIWDNLHYKFSWGSDLAFWGNDGWSQPTYYNQKSTNKDSNVWSQMNRGYTWQVENVLSYDKTFNRHSFNIVLGQSASRYTSRQLGGNRYDLPEYMGNKANIDFATGLQSDGRMAIYGGAGDPNSLASYFGRLSYNFAERYMLQVTVRRDGSSRFGSNNKWGTFPSVSLGWNLTNEPFMEKRPEWLTNTKVRLSWGKNGNEAIGNFRYTANVSTGNNYAFGANGGEKIILGTKPTGTPNADLRWEESEQYDAGLDFGFLNNSFTFTVDYFVKKTNGMLKEMAIPSYLGESKPWGNVGSMKNSGIEVEAGYKLSRKNFNFSTSLNVSYLKNELTNLGNADGFEAMGNVHQLGDVGRAENGQPYPFFYGWSTDGIFQSDAEAAEYNQKYGKNAAAGDVRFVDWDKNGKIDDSDRHNIGNGYPKWTFGWNINASYKGFDLNMLISGALGSKIADVTRRLDCNYVNLPAEFANSWTEENHSTTMPRFRFDDKDTNRNWGWFSDLYIHNGNYARIKNIQVGYTLPSSLTSKVFISRLRFYVAAENLLTLTSYKGLDPELANDALPGIDRGYYPQARTFTVGLNVNF